PRPLPRAAGQDEAPPARTEPERHVRRRRQGRRQDPPPRPRKARRTTVKDYPRQRLDRPGGHPQPHRRRRRGPPARQPRRAGLAPPPTRRRTRRSVADDANVPQRASSMKSATPTRSGLYLKRARRDSNLQPPDRQSGTLT